MNLETLIPAWIITLWQTNECLGSGFAAGVVGNLVAAGVQSVVRKGAQVAVSGWRGLWRQDDPDLKNHDLLRALRLAECDAMMAVCETCLLEDCGGEPSFLRTKVDLEGLKGISKRLVDAEVRAILRVRSDFHQAYRNIHKLTRGSSYYY